MVFEDGPLINDHDDTLTMFNNTLYNSETLDDSDLPSHLEYFEKV